MVGLWVVVGLTILIFAGKGLREWTLLKAENESLRPFSGRLYDLVTFWLAQTNEPVIFLDKDGTINGVSNSAERMLGQRSVLLIGRPLGSFVEDNCEAHEAIKKALMTGEEIKRQTVMMRLLKEPEKKVDLVAKRYKTKEKDEWWILFKG